MVFKDNCVILLNTLNQKGLISEIYMFRKTTKNIQKNIFTKYLVLLLTE